MTDKKDIPFAFSEFSPATAEDITAVMRIYDDVLTECECGRMSVGWVRGVYPTIETVNAALASGDLYVEHDGNGRVVACGRINTVQVDVYEGADWQYKADPGLVTVLHTLAVLPSEKGKGYGSRFVRFYEALAKEWGRPYLRMDTNEKNAAARALYAKLGYREIGVVPCVFNGIAGVGLVLLEKKI